MYPQYTIVVSICFSISLCYPNDQHGQALRQVSQVLVGRLAFRDEVVKGPTSFRMQGVGLGLRHNTEGEGGCVILFRFKLLHRGALKSYVTLLLDCIQASLYGFT